MRPLQSGDRMHMPQLQKCEQMFRPRTIVVGAHRAWLGRAREKWRADGE
jgi:hypothetical protein